MLISVHGHALYKICLYISSIINYLFCLFQTLRNTLDNMYDARVPNAWKKVSYH